VLYLTYFEPWLGCPTEGGNMRFHKYFEKAVAKVNELRLSDPKIQEALARYDRRSLVFKVREDATYVFHISKDEGVKYELNPAKEPNSMYVELSIDIARKLVYRRTLGILDVLSTKHKNIKMADIEFVKKIFGAK
jgi:hypothetical protein